MDAVSRIDGGRADFCSLCAGRSETMNAQKIVADIIREATTYGEIQGFLRHGMFDAEATKRARQLACNRLRAARASARYLKKVLMREVDNG